MTVKEMCETGVFGVMSDGDKFVVVKDYLVYLDGSYDYLNKMSDDGKYSTYEIDKLIAHCKSFSGLDYPNEEDVIFNRSKRVTMTLAEVRKRLNEPHLVIVD